jgi:hypothetical protein
MQRRARVKCFKVAGNFVGDDAACAAALLALITAKLAPLAYVITMTDTEKVPHVLMLQLRLITRCACAILTHWTRGMLPQQTEAAAEHSDSETFAATSAVLKLHDSPAGRQRVAQSAMGLTKKTGGVGLLRHLTSRFSAFAAAHIVSAPAVVRTCPALAATMCPASNAPTPTAFNGTMALLDSTLTAVRGRFAELDKNRRTWVDGSVHTAFHPNVVRKNFSLASPADLFDGASSTLYRAHSQRALAAVTNADAWLRAKAIHEAFDEGNDGNATVRNREATRLVSCSQEGAGAWLSRHADASVKGSTTESSPYLVMVQRHLGLYLSALAPVLNATAAHRAVSQHERLGDDAINGANHSHRHAEGLRATFTAVTSLSTADAPPGRIIMGDRGDGTPAGKEEARRRYAHINDGHVPDLLRNGAPAHLWEYKCCTAFLDRRHAKQGNGSRACGGAASQIDGNIFAFGNTEEKLRADVLGVAERGNSADGPLNRKSGTGWVAASAKHDYADALRRGHRVTLLVSETTGALSSEFARMLRALDKQSRLSTTHDSTCYGESPASPQFFYAHHSAAISYAIVRADAGTILDKGAYMGFLVNSGMHA